MNRTVAAFSPAPVAGAARPCGHGYAGWQMDQAKPAMATKPASKRHLPTFGTTFGNVINADARPLRNFTT